MLLPTSTIDSRFSLRNCPACGQEERVPLFDLKGDQFCSPNPTYDRDWANLLKLKETDSFFIDRCSSCQFVYSRFLPDAEFLETVYDKVINFQNCRQYSENGSSYSRRMRYLANLVDLVEGDSPLTALDFGSGLGVTLRLLDAISVKAVGYDPSPVRHE